MIIYNEKLKVCKHTNLFDTGRYTTGTHFTLEEHGCMKYCIQPEGLREYWCKDCGTEVFRDERESERVVD